MRASLLHLLPVGLLLAAVPAAAQPDGVPLGVPVDAEPVPARRVVTECRTFQNSVVRTPEDAARVNAEPWCRGGIELPPDSSLVGMPLAGDCHSRFRLHVVRSERERRYYVVGTVVDGGCRAGGRTFLWAAIPRIPPGWEVVFRRRRVERGGDDSAHQRPEVQ